MLKNKKAFLPIVLTVPMLIVIAVIIGLLFLGTYGLIYFLSKYALMLAGLFILVISLITITTGQSETSKKFAFFFMIVGVILLLIPVFGLQQSVFGYKHNYYIYDSDGVVKGTAVNPGIFGVFFPKQNVWNVEKSYYTPGETVKVNVGVFKIFAGRELEYYKVCYKGPISKCFDFTSLAKSSPNALDFYVSFSAPSTTGKYEVYDKWKHSGLSEVSSEESDSVDYFEVKKEITECPEGKCGNPQVYKWYETSVGKGYCDRKECWRFSSPPTCSKSTYYQYQMHCPSGTVIQGKNTNIEDWQSSGCSSCVVVSPPQDDTGQFNETGCTVDATLTCQDGSTIIYQKCVNGVLRDTGNSCAEGQGGEYGGGSGGRGGGGGVGGGSGGTSEQGEYLPYFIVGIAAVIIIIFFIIRKKKMQMHMHRR